MPTELKTLVTLRGRPQYAAYLDDLIARLGEDGNAIDPGDYAKLAEIAIRVLGVHYGLEAPRRARPHGSNRHGEPKAV